MLGLKRETVKLTPHHPQWKNDARNTIALLKKILGKIAVDIQHIGSTAIPHIDAKPIIDIVVGVERLEDVLPYEESLQQHGIIFRGEDRIGQFLFVIGDFTKDTRTHHIHIVQQNSNTWNNYINFRDYLIAFPSKAALYNACKQKLAQQFANDRKSYTQGKQKLIETLLREAASWKQRK